MKTYWFVFLLALCIVSLSKAGMAEEALEGLSPKTAQELDDAIQTKDEKLVADILTSIVTNTEEKTARRVSDYVFKVMPEVKNAFKTSVAVSYFDFDGDVLSEKDKRDLEIFANALLGKKGNPLVTVTGYADRLGSTEYNDSLSMKRAIAVKDFLVSKGVVNIEVVAKGEREPITDCGGGKATGGTINCLQADRRVVISLIPEPRVRRGVARGHMIRVGSPVTGCGDNCSTPNISEN